VAVQEVKFSVSGGTSGVLYTDRRKFDLERKKVYELYPSVAPFTTFITRLSSLPTSDADYKMFEHRSEWVDMKFYVGGAGSWSGGSASTGYPISNLTVEASAGGSDDIGFLVDGLILEFRDASTNIVNGRAVITNVDTQQQIDVLSLTMGASAGAAGLADLADGDIAYVIGNAHEEGSGAPDAWHTELSLIWNSAQIMKTPVEVTGTLLETALRGYSNELARLRNQKMMEHKMLKNKHFLFGYRNSSAITLQGTSAAGLGAPLHVVGSNSRPLRTTMGIVTALNIYGSSSNKFAFTKATTGYDDINGAFETIYERVNVKGVKYGFGAPDVITYFTNTGAGSFINNSNASIQVSSGLSRFGFPVKVVETGHGDLVLAKDIAFKAPYTGNLVIVDPANIGHRVFRNPRYETNIQANDADLVKDQFFSDEGMDISLMETHALMVFS
jgi:hypothetical protein